jgi:hypothetical protein
MEMDNEKAQKRGNKRRAANESLRLELETLRESMSDMLDQFKIKVDAELARLIAATQDTALSVSTVETMLAEVRALKIKPNKVRAKDFERLAELTEDLVEQLPASRHAEEPRTDA